MQSVYYAAPAEKVIYLLRYKYLQPCNCVQANDTEIELLVLHSNTYKHLTVYEQMTVKLIY